LFVHFVVYGRRLAAHTGTPRRISEVTIEIGREFFLCTIKKDGPFL
jgi:hypothetical protein